MKAIVALGWLLGVVGPVLAQPMDVGTLTADVAVAGKAPTRTCPSLASLRLAPTKITQASVAQAPAQASVEQKSVEQKSVEQVPAEQVPAEQVPAEQAHCVVTANTKQSGGSAGKLELWLPTRDWNGKLLMFGHDDGGVSMARTEMAGPLRRGYVVASIGTAPGGSGAAAVDSAARAVHETVVAAKAVTAAFYGATPRYSYWSGDSFAGRQGLNEARLYPGDFDGLVVGMPAKVEARDAADLAAFRARGAKIIEHEFSADAANPSEQSIEYFERVAVAQGGLEQDEILYRLFVIPAPDPAAGSYSLDWIVTLEEWVEEGRAPDSVLANHLAPPDAVVKPPPPGALVFEPPYGVHVMCAYPSVARLQAGLGEAPVDWIASRAPEGLDTGAVKTQVSVMRERYMTRSSAPTSRYFRRPRALELRASLHRSALGFPIIEAKSQQATAMVRTRIGRTLLLGCLLGACGLAHALDPSLKLSQYGLDNWQIPDGLPQSSAQALARTPDGYLWIGTQEGLARFDGVRFTVFDGDSAPAIPSKNITALLADRSGRLWVGTRSGVAVLDKGRFEAVPGVGEFAHAYVRALGQGAGERLWVGTENGLFRIDSGKVTSLAETEGIGDNRIRAVLEDRDGSVWVGTQSGLARLLADHFVPVQFATTDHESATALLADEDGTLWIGSDSGALYRRRAELVEQVAAPGRFGSGIMALTKDREGSLWIATRDGGLIRWRDGVVDALASELFTGEICAPCWKMRKAPLDRQLRIRPAAHARRKVHLRRPPRGPARRFAVDHRATQGGRRLGGRQRRRQQLRGRPLSTRRGPARPRKRRGARRAGRRRAESMGGHGWRGTLPAGSAGDAGLRSR